MTSRLLAWRNVSYRPTRSLLLCAGFGLGVGVMITLLAVGEAMVSQASRERLVGGGEVTVLPEGIDIEVLTTGGLGGLFFSVPNARFVYQQVLTSPRLAGLVRAAAPQLEGKLLYVSTADGVQHPVRATGEFPSASTFLGALPAVVQGQWRDSDEDRRQRAPTLQELRHDIDHFHMPPDGLANRASWGEWHYFNVLAPDSKSWAFISFIVGGDVTTTSWGGQVLVTLHERGRPARRFSASVPRERVRFSTTDANVQIGDASVSVRDDGAYVVHAMVREEGGGQPLSLDLVVTPDARAYFPGATLVSGDFASGYVVPGLRASASGRLCAGGACTLYDAAQAYHDHNWGGWSGVTWDWGSTRAGEFTLLYGRVIPESSAGADSPLFVYVTDSSGFVALFRPRRIAYADTRQLMTRDGPIMVPSSALLLDVRGNDTLRLEIAVDDAAATDTRRRAVERGESEQPRQLMKPWFVQMAGTATIGGRIRGRALSGSGRGFFETYR